MKSYKPITSTGSPLGLIEGAVSELNELGNELDEWKSSMEGTALENTTRFETLEEAAQSLLDVEVPDIEWPHADASVSHVWMTPKRKRRQPSRQVRLDNANNQIQAVIDFYESLDELPADFDLSEIEELKVEVEIPGMYG